MVSLVWTDSCRHCPPLGTTRTSVGHHSSGSIWYCSLSVQSVEDTVVRSALSVLLSAWSGTADLSCRYWLLALGHQVFDEDVTRDWLLHWTGLLTAGTALGRHHALVFGQLLSVIQVLGSGQVVTGHSGHSTLFRTLVSRVIVDGTHH